MIFKKSILVLAVTVLTMTFGMGSALACDAHKKTVLFGDSNTKGSNWELFGYKNELKWSYKLGLERPVVNLGVAGNTTGMALARMNEVLVNKPQTVTVMFGTNDAVLNSIFIPRTSWRQFEINLNKMVDTFQANNIDVVLMTTLPIIEKEYYKRHNVNLYLKYGGARKFHDKYNDITRRVASEQGVPLMDTYRHFLRFLDAETDEALYASNLIDPTGTHLAPYGARILFSNLDITLQKAGY